MGQKTNASNSWLEILRDRVHHIDNLLYAGRDLIGPAEQIKKLAKELDTWGLGRPLRDL